MTSNGVRQSIFYILLLYALSSLVSIGGTSITMYLALLLALVFWFRDRWQIPSDARGVIYVAGFFIAALAVTAVFSTDLLFSAKRVLAEVTRFIPLLLVVLFIDAVPKLKAIVAMLALSTLAADGYAIWQSFHGFARPFAFANQPVVFAALLLGIIPLLTVVGLEEKAWNWQWRGGLLAVALLSIFVMVLTGTRGAWIAMAVTFLVYVVLAVRHNRQGAIIVALVLILLCAAFLSVPVLKERINSISDTQLVSNTERLVMWTSAWQMFKDHPLTGVGLGRYSDMDRLYYWQPQAQEPVHVHAHSTYFNFLGETGLIGFAAFWVLFGYILYASGRKYWANRRDYWSLAMLLTTIAFLIEGLTEYNFGHLLILRLFTFVLGLTLVGSRFQRARR